MKLIWNLVGGRWHAFRQLPPGGSYSHTSLCKLAFVSHGFLEEERPASATEKRCGQCDALSPAPAQAPP